MTWMPKSQLYKILGNGLQQRLTMSFMLLSSCHHSCWKWFLPWITHRRVLWMNQSFSKCGLKCVIVCINLDYTIPCRTMRTRKAIRPEWVFQKSAPGVRSPTTGAGQHQTRRHEHENMKLFRRYDRNGSLVQRAW